MGKIRTWEFGEAAAFDGRGLYAEVTALPERILDVGTLELVFCAADLNRATLLAQGVPGRDEGAFTVTMTHSGAVVLTCTDAAGAPCRFRTADRLVGIGERVQATLAWGRGGAFTVVNLDRRREHPEDPRTGHVCPLPPDLTIAVSGHAPLVFAAAAAGAAPFFRGRIDRVTLADRIEPPSVAAASAQILWLPFGRPAGGCSDLMVATPDGDRPIAEIRAGDPVLTRDHGVMPVISNMRVELGADDIEAAHPLRPRLVRGSDESVPPLVLGPLQRLADVRRRREFPLRPGAAKGNVVYHHLLFAQAVAIRANGLWIEMQRPCDALPAANAVVRPSDTTQT